MAGNNEEQRKKVIFFKKADTSIGFDTNIIPKFSKSATTAVDEHGTWTASYSRGNGYTSVYCFFDHNLEVWGAGSYATTSKTYNDYVLLELPEGLAVSPETIVSTVYNNYSSSSTYPYEVHVRGLNADTGAWDILTETHTPQYNKSGKFTTYTDTVLTTKQFYTKFRFYIKKVTTTSSENRLWIVEYQITKGRYKKI